MKKTRLPYLDLPYLGLIGVVPLFYLVSGCNSEVAPPKADVSVHSMTGQPIGSQTNSTIDTPQGELPTETKRQATTEKQSMWVTLAGMRCH